MNRNNNVYNLDPKYIKCAGCPKPAGLRRTEGSLFSAYKGHDNKELCHKCARCYKCGKKEKWECYSRKNINEDWKLEEGDFRMLNYYEKDEKNPSGGWYIAFCLDCADKGFVEGGGCLLGRHESSYQYWKVDGVKIGSQRRKNHEWKFEQFKQAHEKAQNYWNSLSSSEREKECERVVEDLKLGKLKGGKLWEGNKDMEGYGAGWACDGSFWGIKNGKYVSDKLHLVPVEIAEEFYEKMFGGNSFNELVLRDFQIVKKNNNDDKDNSPSPNQTPVAPVPQPITNSKDKSDNPVVQSDNSPKLNPGADNSPEIKINLNQAENPKNTPAEKPNETKKDDNQTLVINLKDIKKISLVGGDLVIEFNQSEKTQVVVSEQVTDNRELSAVKDYLQKNSRSSLNSQELANIISQKNTDNSSSSSPTQPAKSPFLWIAGVGAIGIMVGLCCGLVVKVKKLRPKKK